MMLSDMTFGNECVVEVSSASDVTEVAPEYSIEELKRMAIVATPQLQSASSEAPEETGCPPLPDSARLSSDLGAAASPWLDGFIAFCQVWAPRAYHGFYEAIGLWLLAVVAAGRVTLNFSKDRFPSLMIALCSRTSLYTKSTATEIALAILRELTLDWLLLPSSLTPQRFIHEMAGVIPDNYDKLAADEQDHIKMLLALSGKRGWVYEEFGEKLNSMMKPNGIMGDFRGHLRRFDDGLQAFQYATMGRGIENIERPYLSLLANLTPADLGPFAQSDGPLWHDGFFARFAFVTPSSAVASSRKRFPNKQRVIPSHLVAPLKAWHLRLRIPEVEIAKGGEGGYEWTLKEPFPQMHCTLGSGVYEAFYRYGDALLDIVEKSQRTHLDGSYARFAEKALRISMLLASLENGGVIEMRHWARAQEITEHWRRDLHNLVGSLNEQGPSRAQEDEERVLRQLNRLCSKSGRCTARQISQHIHGMDTAVVERYLDALVRSGVATKETGKNTNYYLPTGS